MKTKIVSIMAACFCSISFCAKPAEATLVIIAIEAVVDDVYDPYNYLGGMVVVGDPITGSYAYDTDTPDSNPLASVGDYEHYIYPYGFSLGIGGLDFVTDPTDTNFLVEIGNNASGDDFYIVVSYNNLPLYSGMNVNNIRFVLGDPSETAISSTALPTTAPDLGDWEVNYLNIGGGPGDGTGFVFLGRVTSAVVIPEPTTILFVGIGGVIFVRRIKK